MAPRTGSLQTRLRSAGIRPFDVNIHDQPREWLLRHFSAGATDYPVNVARLMRNIIWQTRERIRTGKREPLRELIRTFWYMHVKPTLSRVGALAEKTDQYDQMIEQLVFMVKKLEVMKYKDIGFSDDNQAHRRVGANANIVLFSEKLGHQNFLNDVAEKYQVSIMALGGQPSVLSAEYFVDSLRAAGVDLRRSFYLFGIVDYDPSGWIIRDAFLNNLRFYGIPNMRVYDLITPDRLTPEEIRLSRVRFPVNKSMKVKNARWLKQVHARDFRDQYILEEKDRRRRPVLYGLEAESVSSKRLMDHLEEVMVPRLGKSEDLLRVFELRNLDKAIKRLILHKVA